MSKMTTCLWFDGKAEEAARFYVSLLPDSRIDAIIPYLADAPGGTKGQVMLVTFTLAGQSYMALNGGPHFQFTPATSFIVNCEDQAEIDRLWDALLEGGTPMQCGWLTDRYGLSWQIVPRAIGQMMQDPDAEKAQRVMQAVLGMIKIDLAAVQKAYEG